MPMMEPSVVSEATTVASFGPSATVDFAKTKSGTSGPAIGHANFPLFNHQPESVVHFLSGLAAMPRLHPGLRRS